MLKRILTGWALALALGAQALAAQAVLTAPASTWTVPGDFAALTKAEAVGPGGNGGAGTNNTSGGGGGGGGAYAAIASAPNIVAGNVLTIRIGAGGSGDSTYLMDNTGAKVLEALAGANAVGATPGAWGDGAAGIGATKFDGGQGGGGAARAVMMKK